MRDIPVGNGSLHVNFDDKYQIRDIYFPHVGQENHTEGFPSRFGVWVRDRFSWISSEDWERRLEYRPETLVTNVSLSNATLDLSMVCSDTVASHDNVFIRRVRLTNYAGEAREIRLFFHHDFRIYENKFGDTAYYCPDSHALIHYKKHRYFLINSDPHFDQFVTGRKAFRHNEGTWRDAEDGHIAGNVTTEGSVDSTIRITFNLEPNATVEMHYWIAAGTTYDDAVALNSKVIVKGPASFLDSTASEWKAWVNKGSELDGLSPELTDFYKRSLLIVNTQIDDQGAILAANDHDVTERATDHYSYLWMRDGAFIANALDRAGYGEISKKFFELCCRTIHAHGYFLQKYNPDGTVASGWHPSWDPWTRQPMVPIQEDETALVLWALWEHYEKYRDIDFALWTYREMVTKAADFMTAFRDDRTGLPKPSWNLWEDRRGVHTFTCSTVVAGLRAAANFADVFNDGPRAGAYRTAADEIVAAMAEHLFSTEHGRFLRGLLANGDADLTPDPIIDASLFGTFYFGAFDANDEKVRSSMQAVIDQLSNGQDGVARFEGDPYMRDSEGITGNSWFICTLWVAEYHIACAETVKELAPALRMLEWVAEQALPSGVLAEQFDPATRKHTSVSPLTWSHSTFIATLHSYLDKKRVLES